MEVLEQLEGEMESMCTSMKHTILSQHFYARPSTSTATDDADDETDNVAMSAGKSITRHASPPSSSPPRHHCHRLSPAPSTSPSPQSPTQCCDRSPTHRTPLSPIPSSPSFTYSPYSPRLAVGGLSVWGTKKILLHFTINHIYKLRYFAGKGKKKKNLSIYIPLKER